MARYAVTLEMRRLGSTAGSIGPDVFEADSPGEAEQKAITEAKAIPALAGFTFAPLLTIQQED